MSHFMECCQRSSTQPTGLPMDKPPCLLASASMPQRQLLDELGLSKLPQRKDGTVVCDPVKNMLCVLCCGGGCVGVNVCVYVCVYI